MQEKINEIDLLINDENFWQNQNLAQVLLKEKSFLSKKLELISHIETSLKENKELFSLAVKDNDYDMLMILHDDIIKLAKQAQEAKNQLIFNGEADNQDCFLEIHAGAGGVESHDWALMLQRMYLRFAQQKKFKIEEIDILFGAEAGIKSCIIKIMGEGAFGWLRSESGVHRLVRISPFNSAGKRMTSYASVDVIASVNEDNEIIIEEKDLKIDTYRASGAGGQHVNTTDSAVRITHLPTSITVQCQNDRSQHKNKATAMSMLKAKLYEKARKEKAERLNAQNANKAENSWGNQIRSYFLQPYQLVKDYRSNYETSDASGILDGNLSEMILSNLEALAIGKKD